MKQSYSGDNMKEFEVIYAEIVEAEDFFDAIEKIQRDGREVLSCSEALREEEDVFNQ